MLEGEQGCEDDDEDKEHFGEFAGDSVLLVLDGHLQVLVALAREVEGALDVGLDPVQEGALLDDHQVHALDEAVYLLDPLHHPAHPALVRVPLPQHLDLQLVLGVQAAVPSPALQRLQVLEVLLLLAS
jgi:hypothetical protein